MHSSRLDAHTCRSDTETGSLAYHNKLVPRGDSQPADLQVFDGQKLSEDFVPTSTSKSLPTNSRSSRGQVVTQAGSQLHNEGRAMISISSELPGELRVTLADVRTLAWSLALA